MEDKMVVIDMTKKLKMQRFLRTKRKQADDILGEVFTPGKDYIITDNKAEALELKRRGFEIEEVTMFICMNLMEDI